jgi:hypothetical protein
VVRRIERERRQLAERAGLAAAIERAVRVAVVLDQPEVVLSAEGGDRVEVERIAEGVGDEERASSSCVTSMLYVGKVTSTKTGTAPNCSIGKTVVGKPAATVITSSPGFTRRSPQVWLVIALNATRFALLPEFTSDAWRKPKDCARRVSNCRVKRPAVSQNSSELSTSSATSSAS